ncbi:hypothetical protein PAXRUDRAFT_104280, partial [Paxillus rubicundulus Ve08.2h10]
QTMPLDIVGHQCCCMPWLTLVRNDQNFFRNYCCRDLPIPDHDARCPEEDNVVQVHARNCTHPE